MISDINWAISAWKANVSTSSSSIGWSWVWVSSGIWRGHGASEAAERGPATSRARFGNRCAHEAQADKGMTSFRGPRAAAAHAGRTGAAPARLRHDTPPPPPAGNRARGLLPRRRTQAPAAPVPAPAPPEPQGPPAPAAETGEKAAAGPRPARRHGRPGTACRGAPAEGVAPAAVSRPAPDPRGAPPPWSPPPPEPPPREEPPPAAPSPRLKDRKGSAATQHQDVQATGAPSPRLPYIEASPPSARRLFQKPPEPSGRTLPNRRRGRAPAPAPWTPPAPTLGPRGPTLSRPAPHGRAARARADRRTPARPGAPGKVSRLPGPSPLALPPRPLRSARRRPRPHDPCSARVGPTAALVNRQPCPGRGECDRGLSARGLSARGLSARARGSVKCRKVNSRWLKRVPRLWKLRVLHRQGPRLGARGQVGGLEAACRKSKQG